MAAPVGGALFYTPELHERAYYDGLFQAADLHRTGNIGGPDAVAFFSRSKLPIDLLKNVWTVADNPPSNSLDRPKFAVAVRLVQLLQNGVKGQGSNLSVPPGTVLRPVFLEGISGVVVPVPNPNQPPPQQQQQQQQQPPPPQQQQQQQLPPQQQQRPPQGMQQGMPPGHPGPASPPQQQQMQQQPPPSPARPPQQLTSPAGRPPMVQPAGPSMALTVQDPYTLTPNERSRYESLFPQYANEDGFMYGKEAVQLFSKSGLGQVLLRDIWNIADQPVDNRLDKLEFAIAMHLIVCVSKKNLPMPKVLPISLKALKQQQQQQQQQMQAQMQMQAQNEEDLNPPGHSGMQGAPPYNPHPQMPGPQAQPGENNMPSGMSLSGMPGPPPISKPGGLGISDAFEGLNASENMSSLPPPASGFGSLGGFGGGVGNETSYGGTGMTAPMEQQSPRMDSAPPPMPSPPSISHTGMSQPPAMSMRSATPEAPPKSSEVLAQSYNMSDNTGELDKMKVVLQKLQAENIALKAQLGTMTEDEKDVQRQLNATVAEIGVLSSRLTTLRAQVLASKASLMEATAELKAAQEKKGVLSDSIGEAQATKEAIDMAHQGLETSRRAIQNPRAQQAPAPAFEADLFGFGAAPAPHPVSSMAQAPSYGAHLDPPYGQQTSAPAPFLAAGYNAGVAAVETVSDASSDEQEDDREDAQEEGNAEPMFRYDGSDRGAPPNMHGHDAMDARNNQFGQDPYQGISYEQPFMGNRPAHNNRQSSISSQLSFEVMGGGPVPQNHTHQGNDDSDDDYNQDMKPAPSMNEINDLLSRAKIAEDLAQEASAMLNTMMNNTDKLRRAADTAEVEARQKATEASEKKSGVLGGGKKKKSMKEAAEAKADAEEKKKKFLAAQSAANDAQAVAMETKREAENLRKQAEQAELDAAAAASMQQKQPAPAPKSQETNGYPPQAGYGQPPSQGYNYGQPSTATPSQGYGQPPPPDQGFGGYGQPPPGSFNPSVMGQPSGGLDIPDPYSNPF